MKLNLKKRDDIIWLAGIVDRLDSIGENEGKPQISLRMSGKLPKILQKRFGGTAFNNGRGVWWWKLRGKKVGPFLRLILPYLKLHRGRAERILHHFGAK